MIKIAICDDNLSMLEKLNAAIFYEFSKYTDDFKIVRFSNGTSMLVEHHFNPFDVIFLDIDMPKMSGFEVAKALRDEFSHCFIIFVTNHSDLIYDSMDFQPFHFIRKNCADSLEISISNVTKKLMKHIKQNDTVILEDDISGRCVVFIRDIIYIESTGHYVNYYVSKKDLPIRIRETMKKCEENFNGYDFIRIHKSYLINLKYLAQINSKYNEVKLKNLNTKLPMSKTLKKSVDEKFTFYLRSTV